MTPDDDYVRRVRGYFETQPTLTFLADDVDEAYGFEGLRFWVDDGHIQVEAAYDNDNASVWVTLDAARIAALRALLAEHT